MAVMPSSTLTTNPRGVRGQREIEDHRAGGHRDRDRRRGERDVGEQVGGGSGPAPTGVGCKRRTTPLSRYDAR